VAAGQAAEETYPILATRVAEVLAAEGVMVAASDICVPAGIAARRAHAELRIASIAAATGSAGRYWVKVECRDSGDCLPFYVTVDSSTLLQSGVRQVATGKVLPQHHAGVPVVRAGAHVTLVIHGDRTLITLSVVTLQSGDIGDVIRVATPDHKQVLQGQIVNATELQGGA
jgi:hypothetical protein